MRPAVPFPAIPDPRAGRGPGPRVRVAAARRGGVGGGGAGKRVQAAARRDRRRGRFRLAWLLAPLLASAWGCTLPRWPVDGRLTSAYGIRWTGVSPDFHPGVDISVPLGTEVRAMKPGRVRYAGTMRGYGRVVWLDHGGELLTVYAHLSEVRVQTGQDVDHRELIGLSGRSGNATAPHLHFEVWRWGRERDPVPLLGGAPGR